MTNELWIYLYNRGIIAPRRVVDEKYIVIDEEGVGICANIILGTRK